MFLKKPIIFCKYSLLTLSYLLTVQKTEAQIFVEIEKNIDYGGVDFSEDFIIIDDYIYVCGYTDKGIGSRNYIALSKLDKFGNVIWNKTYGNNLDDKALGIIKTKNKQIVVCGQSETSASEVDAMLAKMDTLGNLIWIKNFPEVGTQTLDNLIESIDSSYIACGSTAVASALNEALIVKYDTSGTILWQQTIGDVGNEYANGIAQSTYSQSYFLSFDTNSFIDNYDVGVAKINNADGAIEWQNSYPYPFTGGSQNIIFTTDNNLLVIGETVVSSLTAKFDNYVQKIDTNGVSLWQKNIGKDGSDAAFSVIETNNKFYITGYSSSNTNTPASGNDLSIVCTDTSGTFIWQYFVGGTGAEIGRRIIEDDSKFWITAKNSTLNDFYLINFSLDLTYNIKENPLNSLELILFPNPTNSNKINLSHSNKNEFNKFAIFNLDNQKLFYGNIIANKIELDEQLVNGTYLVELQDLNNNRLVKKFVVEK
ncbi:MAG: T9SS type A sorting domain-containing protein [Bacteroidota bacterium]